MHRRITTAALAAALVLIVLAVVASPAGATGRHDRPRSATIDLPAGFQGEGVASGRGSTFYAGSRADGRVARGDVRAGTSEVFVADPVVPFATGLKADLRHGLLWVAGGPTGQAAVYDLKTGTPVATLTLTTTIPSFINDVTLTADAAYFTNSQQPELYRVPVSTRGTVGAPETIPLIGPAGQYVPGFNLNGIASARGGRSLVVVNSTKGELYAVESATGESVLIDIGGVSVASGDGILLIGRTLYVLQNGAQAGTSNQIVVVRLSRDLTRGQVVDTFTSPLFETATTLAASGDLLLAVNAQFAGAPIDPEAEVVVLDRPDGRR